MMKKFDAEVFGKVPRAEAFSSQTDAKRPAPLSPPDCDIRGYNYMPLYGQQLFTSEFTLTASPIEFRCAVKLWWEAWQQCPAGSLPSNPYVLCALVGFGQDMRKWRKVASIVLHGFVECSDGRLYHPLLCSEAQRVHRGRLSDRARKARYKQNHEVAAPPDAFDIESPTAREPQQSESPNPQRNAEFRVESREEETIGKEKEKSSPYGTPSPSVAPLVTKADGRGIRLPSDWRPDHDDQAFAMECGLDPARVADEFCDYWVGVPGARGRKLNWSATFRNRCRELARSPRQHQRVAHSRMAWMAQERPATAPYDLDLTKEPNT